MYGVYVIVIGTSLVVQWLRLHASTAGGAGSIPGWGTKIPHALWYGKKKKKVTVIIEKVNENIYMRVKKIYMYNSNFNFWGIWLMFSDNKFYFRHPGGRCGTGKEDGKEKAPSTAPFLLFCSLSFCI